MFKQIILIDNFTKEFIFYFFNCQTVTPIATPTIRRTMHKRIKLFIKLC